MKLIHKVDDGSGDPKLKIIRPREFPTFHRRQITTGEAMKKFSINGVQLKHMGGLHPPTFNCFLLIDCFRGSGLCRTVGPIVLIYT